MKLSTFLLIASCLMICSVSSFTNAQDIQQQQFKKYFLKKLKQAMMESLSGNGPLLDLYQYPAYKEATAKQQAVMESIIGNAPLSTWGSSMYRQYPYNYKEAAEKQQDEFDMEPEPVKQQAFIGNSPIGALVYPGGKKTTDNQQAMMEFFIGNAPLRYPIRRRQNRGK